MKYITLILITCSIFSCKEKKQVSLERYNDMTIMTNWRKSIDSMRILTSTELYLFCNTRDSTHYYNAVRLNEGVHLEFSLYQIALDSLKRKYHE